MSFDVPMFSALSVLLLAILLYFFSKVFESITNELDSKVGAGAASTVRGGGDGGQVVEVATTPIEGMKPGTSGLRKKVRVVLCLLRGPRLRAFRMLYVCS